MEKYNVQLSITAKEDIKNIINYIKYELLEPSIANKYAKLLKNELKSLEYQPQRYSIVDSNIIGYSNIRKMIIKNYIAFYRINFESKKVNIERVLYGGSNWINKI